MESTPTYRATATTAAPPPRVMLSETVPEQGTGEEPNLGEEAGAAAAVPSRVRTPPEVGAFLRGSGACGGDTGMKQ